MANTTNHSPEFEANKGRFGRTASDVQRKIASMGGIAKAEKERRIKDMAEVMRAELQENALMLLDAGMLDGVKAVFEKFNLPLEKGTNLMGVLMGQMKKAQSGDSTAAKFLFEVAGIFTETKNLNITGNMPTTAKGDTLYEANDEQDG